MRGYAFLTSSSADEAAQESDLIEASFFTHYLISGMRGAADVTGDGRVTLHEAYQFAFDETRARTLGTVGGTQHPAYEGQMRGTGGVVMTEVRRNAAGLSLDEALAGRVSIPQWPAAPSRRTEQIPWARGRVGIGAGGLYPVLGNVG